MSARQPDSLRRDRYGPTPAAFTAIGWSDQDWWDTLDAAQPHQVHGPSPARLNFSLQAWFREPPKLTVAISPALVMRTLATYQEDAVPVLNAYAAGASQRFVNIVLRQPRTGTDDPVKSWASARTLGLSEPDACGWALTGRLLNTYYPTRTPESLRWVSDWTETVGPVSYRLLLAGITLKEATAMQKAGTVIAEEQLRVMIALNGVALPAGI